MQHIITTLKSVLKQSHEDVEYRKEYSGRGMYGDNCIGIVGQWGDCTNAIAHTINELIADDNLNPEDTETLLSFKYDSMGMDVILYWPELKDESETDEDWAEFYNDLSAKDQALVDDWIVMYQNSGMVPEKTMRVNSQLTSKLVEFFGVATGHDLLAAMCEASDN